MKSFAHPTFFRLFDLLLGASNPGLKRSNWTLDGVDFERERHSFTGSKHGLVIEIFTLTRGGRRGWSLMVTKEYWWAGEESKPLKNLRWARLLSGERREVFTWLRVQEVAMERASSFVPSSGWAPLDEAESNDDAAGETDEAVTVEDDGRTR
jgi:hypothetical protein